MCINYYNQIHYKPKLPSLSQYLTISHNTYVPILSTFIHFTMHKSIHGSQLKCMISHCDPSPSSCFSPRCSTNIRMNNSGSHNQPYFSNTQLNDDNKLTVKGVGMMEWRSGEKENDCQFFFFMERELILERFREKKVRNASFVKSSNSGKSPTLPD